MNARPARGMSLIEALVAVALTGIGVMTVVRSEGVLRLETERTRQRAEAVRLADEALEQMRSFDSLGAYATQVDSAPPQAATLASNTAYSVARSVVQHDTPRYAEAVVTVSWRDRQGQNASVSLRSVIAGVDPALSGRLTAPPASTSRTGPLGRSAAIPWNATNLGDGRSAWQPPGAPGIAWVFDNASGQVTAVCRLDGAVAAASLKSCETTSARPLTGRVAFATGPQLSTDDAVHPGSKALLLQMQLTLSEGNAAGTSCYAATDADSLGVSYACLVQPDAQSGHWSGRLDLTPQGWAVGTTESSYRVCRYSADTDGNGSIGNSEHPLDYLHVDRALQQQNFLVVRGDHACPVDRPADPSSGHFVDASTVEQAPTPTPTPAPQPR
jgi:Tfp pilus assembly protein PilV